jgi:hypothetical protein
VKPLESVDEVCVVGEAEREHGCGLRGVVETGPFERLELDHTLPYPTVRADAAARASTASSDESVRSRAGWLDRAGATLPVHVGQGRR